MRSARFQESFSQVLDSMHSHKQHRTYVYDCSDSNYDYEAPETRLQGSSTVATEPQSQEPLATIHQVILVQQIKEAA
jgi:hypothetical protein